ncbi:Hypothetical protein GSB_153196 [Giardia duodenalis]|uniref:Uncharacterized protein n=1 Tax=Giardia intestinalis TaxID=5741 RepID=V6TMX3_GIAIN|nr:Hypothetical protein GSB_153196 [Giardia intestinalis]
MFIFYRYASIDMVPGAMTPEVRASVLLKLAEQVISTRKLDETPASLVKKPLLLHRHVLQTPINWRRIAGELSEDRSRIYHWYRETHSRKILNMKMTAEDRKAIKAMIIAGVRDRTILDSGFYERVRERFGAKYPRQELRMTYNNAVRTQDVRAAMEECAVAFPPRRSYRFRTKGQEQAVSLASAAPAGLTSPAPCMLGYVLPPPVQAVGAGGQLLMGPLPPVPALPLPHAPGCLVVGVPPPGFSVGPGAPPLQAAPSPPPLHLGPGPSVLPSLSHTSPASRPRAAGQDRATGGRPSETDRRLSARWRCTDRWCLMTRGRAGQRGSDASGSPALAEGFI